MRTENREPNKPLKILLITTGGTIDSKWDPTSIYCHTPNENSIIKDHINQIIKPYFDITEESIGMIDSRDMTPSIMQKAQTILTNAPHECILITTGTFAIVNFAQFLKQNLPTNSNKKVILTGSFTPINGFTNTDAMFNLGFAIGSFNTATAGVYVAMHGKLFDQDTVFKNSQTSRFETKP